MDVSALINNAALEYSAFKLPSNGRCYNISEVMVRPTRTVEEKFLRTIAKSSSDFNDKINRYLMMVTNFAELEMNPAELTSSDQLALLIYSRILSKDSIEYPAEIVCPSCGKTHRHIINLMDLDMIYLPDDFEDLHPVYLPLHDLTLIVRMMRVKDYANVASFHQEMLKVKVDLGDPEDDTEGLYASVVVDIIKDGESIKMAYSDKRELLISLDAKSFNLLPEDQNKYYHGYDLVTDFKCPTCLENTKVPFDLGADFFFRTNSTNV